MSMDRTVEIEETKTVFYQSRNAAFFSFLMPQQEVSIAPSKSMRETASNG